MNDIAQNSIPLNMELNEGHGQQTVNVMLSDSYTGSMVFYDNIEYISTCR